MRARGRGWVIATLPLLVAGCGAARPVAAGALEEEAEPARAPPRYAVALRFQAQGEDEEGTPRTEVALVRIGPDGERTVEEISTELGACYYEREDGVLIEAGSAEPSELARSREVITARCWWAGAGARFVVRREGGAVVVLRGDTDHELGDQELSEVARLEVPEEAELDLPGALP